MIGDWATCVCESRRSLVIPTQSEWEQQSGGWWWWVVTARTLELSPFVLRGHGRCGHNGGDQ